jgi:CO dehydrogenase maturation factor
MKLAISGKGGVGKTTLTVLMAREALAMGLKTLVIDADPDANLAMSLGLSEEITPLADLRDLIAERTGGEAGLIKLNPRVDDIPERYSVNKDGVRLMVLGAIRRGGAGCACPESAFLRALLGHLLLERDEIVVIDMEAGIEHLGRGTAQAVDALLVVVEPDKRSLATAGSILTLAHEIGLGRVFAVANKVRSPLDREYIEKWLPTGLSLLSCISYDEEFRLSSREGLPATSQDLRNEIRELLNHLMS